MDFRPRGVGLASLLVLSSASAQTPTPQLDLYTFPAPPYQVTGPSNYALDHVAGETVETVNCAAGQTGWLTRIRLAPPNRGLHLLRRNLIDGYFAIDPSPELDAVADHSDPLALEKWYFFSRKQEPNPQPSRIGVVSGSNQEAWLLANGYPVYLSVASPEQLLALLRRGRIDTALMDERVMASLQQRAPETQAELQAEFVRYAPLHLYLSADFTAKHPDFLNNFNRALPDCMAARLKLSEEESRKVHKVASALMQGLNQTLDLREAIQQGPHVANFSDVLTIDAKWRALAPNVASPMAEQILGLPGSRALQDWRVSQNGMITEILLINEAGTLAAISSLSTDYWQGDEANFQNAMPPIYSKRIEGQVAYLSPIHYDASTGRFQITVSHPVASEDGSEAVGVVAMGLNIESVLKKADSPPP